MPWSFSGRKSRFQRLLVALAILGMVISVFPTPVPAASGSQAGSCETDSPLTSVPDGAEDSDSLDEANGLAAQPGNAQGRFRNRLNLRPLTVLSDLQPHSTRSGLASLRVNLPILLCRLTC